MNRQIQAALRSALVCPGYGQWWLGRRGRGAAIMIPTLIVAIYFISDIMEQIMAATLPLQERMMEGQIPDLADIVRLSHEIVAGQALSINPSLYLLIVLWVAGTVDAWLVGRQPPAVQAGQAGAPED